MAIQDEEIARLQRNLEDEKRILFDERSDRLNDLIGGRLVQVDLHDEKTNRRLVKKGELLSRPHFDRMLRTRSEAASSGRDD